MPCRFLPVHPIRKVFDIIIAFLFGLQLLIWCSGTSSQLASSFTMRPLHRILVSQRGMMVGHPKRTFRVLVGAQQQWANKPFHSGQQQHWISMRCGSSSFSTSATSSGSGTNTNTNTNTNANTSTAKSDPSEYEHWVRRLYMTNMFNPVKLGLENIQKIHELLGNPMDDVRT
jgi:hypothetical protein